MLSLLQEEKKLKSTVKETDATHGNEKDKKKNKKQLRHTRDQIRQIKKNAVMPTAGLDQALPPTADMDETVQTTLTILVNAINFAKIFEIVVIKLNGFNVREEKQAAKTKGGKKGKAKNSKGGSKPAPQEKAPEVEFNSLDAFSVEEGTTPNQVTDFLFGELNKVMGTSLPFADPNEKLSFCGKLVSYTKSSACGEEQASAICRCYKYLQSNFEPALRPAFQLQNPEFEQAPYLDVSRKDVFEAVKGLLPESTNADGGDTKTLEMKWAAGFVPIKKLPEVCTGYVFGTTQNQTEVGHITTWHSISSKTTNRPNLGIMSFRFGKEVVDWEDTKGKYSYLPVSYTLW